MFADAIVFSCVGEDWNRTSLWRDLKLYLEVLTVVGLLCREVVVMGF